MLLYFQVGLTFLGTADVQKKIRYSSARVFLISRTEKQSEWIES